MESNEKREGRRPRIGSGRSLQEARNEAAAAKMAEDTLGRSAEEQGLSDEEVVARRQAFKDAYAPKTAAPLITINKTKASSGVEGLLDEIAGRVQKVTTDAKASRLAELEREAQPLLDEAHALATRFGTLQANHREHVFALAAKDWAAIRTATPKNFTMVGDRMISPTHEAIWRLEMAIENARVINGTLGDSQGDKNNPDPYSLASAVDNMKGVLQGGAFDKLHGGPSANFRRAVQHMTFWLEKARRVVDGATEAVARLAKAEAMFEEAMVGVTLTDVAPTPEKLTLPAIEPTPAWMDPKAQTSGMAEWEPRSIMREPTPDDGVTVTPLGDGDGYQVGGAR